MKTIESILAIEDLTEKRKALLENTIEYFGKNPSQRRSVSPGGGCSYFCSRPESDGCAVGRLLGDNDTLKKSLDNSSAGYVKDDEVFSNLPDNIKALGVEYLGMLQQLHDNVFNWDNELSGLSESGKEFVEKIKAIFNLN